MKVEVSINEQVALTSGFPTVAISVPDLGAHEVLDINFDTLVRAFGEPHPVTLDLLLIAGISYVLDKCVPRRLADDFWTREFEVEFPVSNAALWERAGEALTSALGFLTGDEWSVAFETRSRELHNVVPRPRNPDASMLSPDKAAVGLFSGGLDSLVGVLDHLSSHAGSMLLVGHHDATGAAGDQERLRRLIEENPLYRGRTQLLRVRLRPLPASLSRPGQLVTPIGREHTLRSRSLVFLALGMYSARALGPDVPLLLPENGFIAVNIPLTPSRIGACSTRTTHPFFLREVGRVLEAVGMTNSVHNPFILRTKGEVVRQCRVLADATALSPETVSCAHSSRRATWRRRGARNCGYCVPCIIRRAALHGSGIDDGSQYGIDFLAGELDTDEGIAADLRAVLDCIDQVRSDQDVRERVGMSGPIPVESRDDLVDMVRRGLEEVRSLVRDKGTEEIRTRAGIR